MKIFSELQEGDLFEFDTVTESDAMLYQKLDDTLAVNLSNGVATEIKSNVKVRHIKIRPAGN